MPNVQTHMAIINSGIPETNMLTASAATMITLPSANAFT